MDEKIIFSLMQNVSDQLSEIILDIKEIKKTKTHKTEEVVNHESMSADVNQFNYFQYKKSLNIISEQKRQIENIETTIENTNHYSVFGKDSSITSKGLLLIIFLLLIFSNGIKHIPIYLNEHSQIKKERDEFKQVYDFLYLYHFEEKDDYSITLSDLLKHSKSKKPVFIKKLKSLRKKHDKGLKEKKLKEQLKAIENVD